MLAMGVFITALGEQFMKYMQEFYPYLRLGLQNHQEWQVRAGTLPSVVVVLDGGVLVAWSCFLYGWFMGMQNTYQFR